MSGYIRRSISRKFMTAVMATTFVAVLVSGLANLAYDIHDYRVGVVQDLTSQADLLSKVSQAALEFDDVGSVQDTLAHLRARPGVLAAAVYRADNTLFASYASAQSPAAAIPQRPKAEGNLVDGDDLVIFRSIRRGREQLGTIYLRAAYPLDARIARNVKTLCAVIVASLLIAALVSLWLQAAVTRPVMAVTDAVRELIARRDYSRRVDKTTEDETGLLVDAFNTMLGEIGAHALQIEKSNASLQHEVAERTRADLALQELNASLEQRIAARSRDLEAASEQLRHAQKMEAIGQLTGGVAHDFNNVLHVISGNLQLLAMSLPGDSAAQRRIQTARFATERGAKLSSQLLSFARRQPLKPTPTNLGRVLRNTVLLGAVVALSLLVAALVSSWLQAGVTRPLAALTRAVHDVVSRRDFSQRVAK
ncbi:MAG: hypothetical protein H7176_10935, partial [Bdellovibrionales bacterium]|nr:hypothetical protein [Massilia sp.]